MAETAYEGRETTVMPTPTFSPEPTATIMPTPRIVMMSRPARLELDYAARTNIRAMIAKYLQTVERSLDWERDTTLVSGAELGAPLTAAIPIGSYICRGFALGIVVLDAERDKAAIIGWDAERKQ